MNQPKFIATFKEVQRNMYLLSRRLLTSHEEAADAVQETMLKLWERRKELGKIANKEAYAMQMVKNYSLDRLKSKQASHLKIVHSNYESDDRNVLDDLEQEAKVGMVQKMIAELPENYKTVIHLRDIEGYDYEAIERIMDMKSTAVRVVLSRARKLLRKKIEEKYQSYTA
ncbi:RNA polymerase sigma factor [Nonlabens marinus]|uniref:RNA polymerase ECF-type sigma factor n=1 Tax=Nonlabens marinus S1-08 TaxID=1454201 RepID=W8VW75_9FLAO|nr:sigma-70 family RNA polymerase sigma factor [Nonlabens marinus]BAO56083.1 RNA polymerase ECF-type sigma factor [Nonlabens marinus S1-08]